MTRRTLGAIALLVAFPLALVGPALLPDKVLLPHLPVSLEPLAREYPSAARAAEEGLNYSTSDRIFPALTDQLAIAGAVSRGELPTWEPRLGVGYPLLAGTMVGPLHPLHWPAALLPPASVAGLTAVLSLVLAGLGTWLFLRRLGLAPEACAVGALALQGGGWGLANVEYFMKLDAALSLPWQLWAVEGLRLRKRGAGLALALATGASFLAGFPPIAVFCLVTAGVFALARAPRGDAGAGRLRPLLDAALFALLGVALAAAQLVPTAEASAHSIRQDAGPEATRTAALPALAALGVALPDAFGAPTDPPRQEAAAWWVASAGRWEVAHAANALEWNTYAGVACAVLALVGLVARPRAALLPALLLAGCYGFASAWPIARLLYHLPGFGLGAPNRVLAVAWLLWPWLAALGAGALLAGERRARTALCAGALAIALGALALHGHVDPETWPARLEAGLAERFERPVEDVRAVLAPESVLASAERLRDAARFTSLFALATLAAGLGARALAARRGRVLAAAPLLALLFAEALLAGRAHVAPRETSGLPLFPESREIARIAEVAGDGRVVRVDPHLPEGRDVLALARPSLLQPYGVADLATWIIFTPSRLAELVRAVDPEALHGRQIAGLSDPALLGHPVLDRLRVTAVLSAEPLEHPRLEPRRSAPRWHLYARSGSVPPARVVARAVRATSRETAVGLLASGAADESSVVLEGPPSGVPPSVPARWRAGEVEVARPTARRFDARVTGSGGGWLVMQEQFFPGWKATVNGEDAEIVCADVTFRAVRVPPGDSIVRTWYEPASLRAGAAVSLLALAAAAWLGLRRARSREPV